MIVSSIHSLTTKYGQFSSCVVLFGDGQQVASVLFCAPRSQPPTRGPYLRIQYGCLFGHVLGSLDCDCQAQTELSLKFISEGGGVYIYFQDHEAQGAGLFSKANMLACEKENSRKQERILGDMMTRASDSSVLWVVPEILSHIGQQGPFVCLGTNTKKLNALKVLDIEISDQSELSIDESLLSDFGQVEVKFKQK